MYRLLFNLVFRRLDPEVAHELAFRFIRLAAVTPGLRSLLRARLAPAGSA